METQAGKMPDANDSDVGVFPFIKRGIAACGGASTEAGLHVEVKKAWRNLPLAVC